MLRGAEPQGIVGEPDPAILVGVDRDISNLTHMQALTHAAGARFIAVFQPVASFHDNVPLARQIRAVFSAPAVS